jgi:aminoglycoside phosphotransferase (APT) family kinase protein
MLEGIENILKSNMPDFVIIYGDTNSTVAGALAAAKLNIAIAHIEGGVRTKNYSSPEEINRKICDHISTVNFPPTTMSYNNLQKEKIYDHKIEILTELASVNIKQLGLEEFGRPLGYLERQINLWISQYRASQTKEIESMEFLIENIPKFIPKEIDVLPSSLLHGDFRLDNMILKKDKTLNEVAGLLDWELSTLAPPFIDLSYWALMLRFKREWPIGGLGNYRNIIENSGIPSEDMILEKYLNKTGFDKPKYWKYLLAFNSFRFVGILQGIAKRLIDGNNAADNAYQVRSEEHTSELQSH